MAAIATSYRTAGLGCWCYSPQEKKLAFTATSGELQIRQAPFLLFLVVHVREARWLVCAQQDLTTRSYVGRFEG